MRLAPKIYREDQLTPANARTLLIVNLVACPGIGTIMAGRRIGYVQAAAMVGGMCMLLAFVAVYFKAATQVLANPFSSEEQWWSMLRRASWMGIGGLGVCIIAWLWGLATGLSLIRSAKERAGKPPPITIES